MKVLWLANSPSGYLQGTNTYNGGGWIFSAEEEIKKQNEIELAVSFVLDNQPQKVEREGVCYYPLKSGKSNNIISKIVRLFQFEKHQTSMLLQLQKVVDDFQPDIIHVFGTEQFWGLIARYVHVPIVLHIQGVLNPILNTYLIPGVSSKDYLFQSLSPRCLYSNFISFFFFKRFAKRELEITKDIKYYIGRTEWDRRIMNVLHPGCKYFYGSEILRKEFYEDKTRIITDTKPIIVTTISNSLYKGFDLVLKTAKLLVENLKLDFEWRIFGNINSRFVERLTGIETKAVNVKLCGVASASMLRDELLRASVYVHTSYIDNSPNSVCEAQILGVPTIVTHVGGSYSLIEEGVTGFSVPANDPYQMAYLIDKLIKDSALNQKIGENTRTVALRRHDKAQIINSLIETYKNIIKDCTK